MKDDWENSFEGKCDICRKDKQLHEVKPGVQYGWRVGYVCYECSPSPYNPKTEWIKSVIE